MKWYLGVWWAIIKFYIITTLIIVLPLALAACTYAMASCVAGGSR